MKSVFINKPFNVGGRILTVGEAELSDSDIERATRFGVVGEVKKKVKAPLNKSKKPTRNK